MGAGGARFGVSALGEFGCVAVAHGAVGGVNGQQHPVHYGEPDRAGIDAPQNRRAAAFTQVGGRRFGVFRVTAQVPGCKASENQNVVLGGVIVVGGKLRVEQVGHVQVEQLQAAQVLQGGLQRRQAGLELAALAGDPDKALRAQAALLQTLQRVAFLHARALNIKNSHRRAP